VAFGTFVGMNPIQELEAICSELYQVCNHPAHYHLTYGGKIWKQKLATNSLEAASRKSFRHWLERIEELQGRQVLSQKETTLRIAQVTCGYIERPMPFSE